MFHAYITGYNVCPFHGKYFVGRTIPFNPAPVEVDLRPIDELISDTAKADNVRRALAEYKAKYNITQADKEDVVRTICYVASSSAHPVRFDGIRLSFLIISMVACIVGCKPMI